MVFLDISGFLLLLLRYGLHPLLFITGGITHHPVIMGQIIITTLLIEDGYQAPGRIEGPPMLGKELGFQALGNTAHNGLKIA
jgi:hypothetical protein